LNSFTLIETFEISIITKMSMEIAEEEDTLQLQFEALENLDNLASKLKDYIVLLDNERTDDVALKIKEQCIYRLARIYTENKQFSEVLSLLKTNGTFFSIIPKAKTAKIVRQILNIVATVPDSLTIQVELSRDVVEWCKLEKRTFLRQRIEAKLASLLLQQRQPMKALEIIDDLLKEIRKLDDKQMLTECHLTESRIYHALQNVPKSKASLTASRTAANSIYVVPLLQAEIDEMSGILHCEESDYVTAYSYFQEAFDAYDQANNTSTIKCLKYMILCKVLNEAAHEVPALLSSKIGMKHAGKELQAMAAIAKAAKARSLQEFKQAAKDNEEYFQNDDLISHHLDVLYDKMLESNLLKIIHPYSCVEISHIAKLILLPENEVVQKLSQMILDHKFSGILDQGKGHLIIYESSTSDVNYTRGVDVISNLGQVVEVLFKRAKTLQKTVV